MFRRSSMLAAVAGGLFSATPKALVISQDHIPRNFPVKPLTGLSGLAVEPLWKPKLLAAAAEIEAYLKSCDIPEDSTKYQSSMMLPKRVYAAIEECGDDWMTLEKKYFWGWPVEYVLNCAWNELDKLQKYHEQRLWEIDPEQMRKIHREDFGRGKGSSKDMWPMEIMAREDFDKRKQALTAEEMAELKRMDTEKMARETSVYKERKHRIRDDMERARADLLKKFLGKRMTVEPDLKRMQPGKIFNGKDSYDIIADLKNDHAEHMKVKEDATLALKEKEGKEPVVVKKD